MTTVTENDLKRLEDLLIVSREENRQRFSFLEEGQRDLKEQFKEVNKKIDKLGEEINNIKIEIATVKGIEKRLDDLNSRFNIMTVGFLGIVGVLVTGILTAITKLVFFPNPF
jgi:uncharacterized coiled-coil DUF342 family protein